MHRKVQQSRVYNNANRQNALRKKRHEIIVIPVYISAINKNI